MSIEVVCPSGHHLKVKDRYAGKRGRCPLCREPVIVPAVFPIAYIATSVLDEEDDSLPVHQEPAHFDSMHEDGSGQSLVGSSVIAREVRICPKCDQKVMVASDNICPHCNTFFTFWP